MTRHVCARAAGVISFAMILGGPIVAQDPTTPAGPPVRSSWTSDAIAVRQGDLITILIDEFTLASANIDDVAVNERDRNVGVGGSVFGMSIRSNNDAGRRTQGQSARRERFQAEMSARIVEVLPGGLARIEGTRTLMIDEHEQEITVRGLVRANDISAANTVESWRIADAELLYATNGEMTKDASIWSKLFNLIIP